MPIAVAPDTGSLRGFGGGFGGGVWGGRGLGGAEKKRGSCKSAGVLMVSVARMCILGTLSKGQSCGEEPRGSLV